MFDAVVLAFALAMDATAVAAARGMSERGKPELWREAVILSLLFGAFQAGMAALGWQLGAWGGPYIAKFDHWIAFALLAGIGVKMLYDAWKASEHHRPGSSGLGVYLLLALATSIDAAAAGLTLPMLAVAPGVAIAFIGGVAAICSALGYLVGRAVGGRKLEVVGGVILVGIGVRILVQHL